MLRGGYWAPSSHGTWFGTWFVIVARLVLPVGLGSLEKREALAAPARWSEANNFAQRLDASVAAMTADQSSRNENSASAPLSISRAFYIRPWPQMLTAFLKPPRPSFVHCVCPPTGTRSIMSKTPQATRLNDRIKAAREEVARLPAGPERDGLLRQIEQDEVALRVIQWLTSSGHVPPPSDLLPMRRHPLRRND